MSASRTVAAPDGAAADRWEVLLATPADVGDFGLHQDVEVAAATFRRRLAETLGPERAAEVGPEAEHQFRQARAGLVGAPLVWSGFVLVGTAAAAGVDRPEQPAAGSDGEPAGDAVGADAVLISLSVGVQEFAPPPASVPVDAQTLLSRALTVQHGPDARIHLVTYGDVAGVATVRAVEHDVAGTSLGAVEFAPDSPPAHYLLVEIALLFPDAGAIATVTAATPNGAALDEAALLAGSIAHTVRLRSADATGGEAAVRAVLPDGRTLPDGVTVLGRSPHAPGSVRVDRAVTVPDPSVSRTHALLHLAAGRARVTDLGSTNGTTVRRAGGQTVHAAPGTELEVAAGDEIRLAEYVIRIVSAR